MKKIFCLLLFVPLFGFGQTQVDCSLLTVTNVSIQNDSITFAIYNEDIIHTHYPYISYSFDANGYNIQYGQISLYVAPAQDTSWYSYPHFLSYDGESMLEIEYPISIFFTYANLIGENPGAYTCELLYNPQMDILNPEENINKTVLKTIDILGRNTDYNLNKLLIDIFDDGSSQKRIIIE